MKWKTNQCLVLHLGGGCGNELAKWVINGRPDLDMSGYDIRRFCPKVSKDTNWVIERSHEAYAKNYSMIFPHDEPLAGRNMKKVYKCQWKWKVI